MRNSLRKLVAVIALFMMPGSANVLWAQIDLQNLRNWGLETVNSIDVSLKQPGSNLYAEFAALDGSRGGPFNGYAYVWPAATQFRVMNSLAQIDPLHYTLQLRSYSDELYIRYWYAGYRSAAGVGDRFYDDNAHLVASLSEAYRLTGDPVYFDRARQTHAFVLQGEDNVAGGGIYFKQFDFSSKDAISTLQGARGAAMLYNISGELNYLNDATRLLTWAENHIQRPDGLYSERWSIATNGMEGFDLINSAGIAISTNLELYDATGSSTYLTEAQRIATRSLSRYFDSATGRINDEGYWAFELVDGLVDLYRHDGNTIWLERVNDALVWLHDNKLDPQGHYGVFWGRNGPQLDTLPTWELNNMASVARAYLYTYTAAAIPEPHTGALLGGAMIIACRRTNRRNRWMVCRRRNGSPV
jgi:hypothetical protein